MSTPEQIAARAAAAEAEFTAADRRYETTQPTGDWLMESRASPEPNPTLPRLIRPAVGRSD